MDASLLTNSGFWDDPSPCAAGTPSGAADSWLDFPELQGHVLFETSGSSGTPKWVALSKAALRVSAKVVNAHLQVDATSCWGLALPLRHVGGFGVAARAYLAGCGFKEFGSRWDAAAFTRWLKDERVSHTSLVPTQMHDLVMAGLRAPGSLQAVVVGGGHLPDATGRAARDLGWPVLASYGMTEAASQIATQPLSSLEEIYHSSPIPLLPSWQAELTPDGCLRICGASLYSGILTMNDHGWVYTPRNGTWHETRDRVAIGPGGLTPLGRADGCVKVLGELVDPAEIERMIYQLAAGRLRPDALVVVAIPDARSGHALVPVINAAAESGPVDDWLDIYQKKSPGFLRLREAVRLDAFPLSPLGKPRRTEIASMVAAACMRNENGGI